MVSFQISLADVPMKINAVFSSTKQFCRNYLTEEAPFFEITVTQEDIDSERVYSDRICALEGREIVHYSDAYLETLALYRKITAVLLDYNVLLFHGSVIAKDGNAYLFTAKSGTGKTTHTRLWLKNIPDCHVLNGDKPLLLFRDGQVFACGTPWQGKEDYGINEILPLKAICALERGQQNIIEKITFHEIFPFMMTQAHHPDGKGKLVKFVQLISKMESVDMYRLQCTMEDEAALTAYRGMTGDVS